MKAILKFNLDNEEDRELFKAIANDKLYAMQRCISNIEELLRRHEKYGVPLDEFLDVVVTTKEAEDLLQAYVSKLREEFYKITNNIEVG